MIIKVSTGVVFNIQKPTILAIRAVLRQVNAQKPKPPMIYIEEKDRSEPNDNDPDYLDEMQNWLADSIERQYDVAIVTGTTIKSIPTNIVPPESDDWIGILIASGIELGKTQQERYLQWVKFYAAPVQEDMHTLNSTILDQIGVKEEEVTEALDAFRNRKERRANSKRSSILNDPNGN